jgi:hypothetical protein
MNPQTADTLPAHLGKKRPSKKRRVGRKQAMTFDELRAKIGATMEAGAKSPDTYTVPPMTLSCLVSVLGEPKVQRIAPDRISHVIYAVAEGEAAIVARVEGPIQRLTGGLVCLRHRRTK